MNKLLYWLSFVPLLGTSWVIGSNDLKNIGNAATDLASSLSSSFFAVLPYIVPVIVVLMIIWFVVHVIKRR